jgi:hypothetical protein
MLCLFRPLVLALAALTLATPAEAGTIGLHIGSHHMPAKFFGFLEVTTAGVTGYHDVVQPLLVPSISLFTYYGVTPRLAYIPQVEKKIGSHVFHLMVEF